MSTPKPEPIPPTRIDFEDREAVVRLALASLFTSIAIARGDTPSPELAGKCVYCVDALLDAVAAKVVKP
jgi:hypothetical protein